MDELIPHLVKVTEAAALATVPWLGKGDKVAADRAATEAMRKAFESVPISGTVVIGEGERDNAPMLFIGEEVGAGGVEVDIAVDPLEGTNYAATGENGCICVMAVAPRGTLLHAPDIYMDKVSALADVDLDLSVAENVSRVAAAKKKYISEVNVLFLDRDRNKEKIAEARAAGCHVRLIPDGDILGGILPALDGPDDLLLGIGAAPEGVIAAAAMRALGGTFQGRLWTQDDAQRERAVKMGADMEKKHERDELVSADAVVVMTAVTNNEVMQGVSSRTDTITIYKNEVRHHYSEVAR